MRPFALALVLVAGLLAPTAAAQGSVDVTLDGEDIREAATSPDALALDTARPSPLVARITAPADATWDVRAVRVTLVAATAAGATLSAMTRDVEVARTLAPGETLVVERDVDLTPLRSVGAGVFRMEVEVLDSAGATLYEAPFFVRVAGNPLLTLAGAVAMVASGLAAYGLWQLARDLREIYLAKRRHERQREERKGGVGARLARVAGAGLDVTDGLVGIAATLEGADKKAERLAQRRPIAWALTGLGLGSVGVSWGQALGLVPFDVADLLLAAAAGGLLLLFVGLVVGARLARAKA